MTIKLPKPGEVIKAKGINPRLLLLYGPPKVGKTQIISMIKDSYLLIDIEDGVEFFNGTYVQASNLEELNEIGEQILAADKPYKYIIIDTVTELAAWCEDYATGMYRNSTIGKNFTGDSVVGELPKGAGYYWLRKAFQIWFDYIKTLSDRVILLGHVKDASLTTQVLDGLGNKVTVENIGRDEVSSSDVDLTGKLKQIVCAKVDAIGYLYQKTAGVDKDTKKDVKELRVNFNSGSSVLGGARPKHLRGVDMAFDWEKIYLKEEKI